MSVALLLQQYPQLQLQSNNKILCSLTNHEMSPQYKAIISHVEGKKFKKAMEWYKHDFSNYLPHIVPHKRDDKKLFCVLTKETLNKIPAEIEKHVNGKRFLRLKVEKEAYLAKKKENSKKKEVVVEENEDEEEELDFWVPDFPLDEDDDEEVEGEEEDGDEIDDEDEKDEDAVDESDIDDGDEEEDDGEDEDQNTNSKEEGDDEEEEEEVEEIIIRKVPQKVQKSKIQKVAKVSVKTTKPVAKQVQQQKQMPPLKKAKK